MIMNKKILHYLALIFFLCLLSSCEIGHKHTFDIKEETSEYLAYKTICGEKPQYYYHCECGEISSDTFEGSTIYEHQMILISRKEPTYFTYGEEMYQCSICGFGRGNSLPRIAFPSTIFETENFRNIVIGNEYTICGIVTDEFLIKCKSEDEIEFTLSPSLIPLEISINKNDFIVVRGKIESNNEGYFLNDYSVLQHNDTVLSKLEAIYHDEIEYFSEGKYQTGNFGSLYSCGHEFVFIRISDCTIISSNDMNYDAIPGTFQNKTAYGDIESIDITYQCSSGFKVGYSEDYLSYNYIDAPKADYEDTINFELKGADYFRIETTIDDITLVKIVIHYCTKVINEIERKNVGEERKRINLKPYEGSLVPGVSQVTYPTSVTYTDSGYVVNEEKTYTYYTPAYVLENISSMKDAMMVDPIDVINYYIAFNSFPANYAKSKNYREIFNIFGLNARQYSTYSRTDGYVNAIPFKGGEYHEFDIDLDGTYVSSSGKVNRGVGRVVIFENGFDAKGYNNVCVAVFTDTHYLTFQEYYNDGSFSSRFNAEGIYSAYFYSQAEAVEMQ